MTPLDLVYRLANMAGIARQRNAEPFELSNGATHALAEQAADGLPRIFFDHKGRTTVKWAHYIDAYGDHFDRFRGKPVRLLEIGVLHGGSLDLWREYFGPDATIYGIDRDPDCADRMTAPNQVRIGHQDDPDFLRATVDEMGGVDIVIDDGSHKGRHQRASFDALFPLLSEGGLYAIEDLHTSYWPGYYEGGYRRKGTAVAFLKQMIDDLHGWHHNRRAETPARDWVHGITIYDSLALIEKRRKSRPAHVQIG